MRAKETAAATKNGNQVKRGPRRAAAALVACMKHHNFQGFESRPPDNLTAWLQRFPRGLHLHSL
eukprot:scaffold102765_cov15-Tisochrysis_lutea.AAC.1